MGNSGFIALRTRALLCSAASLELQRAELQICKHKKDLEDQKLKSNLILGHMPMDGHFKSWIKKLKEILLLLEQ